MCNICAIVCYTHTYSCGSGSSSSGKCDQLPCTFVVTTDNLLERIEKLFVCKKKQNETKRWSCERVCVCNCEWEFCNFVLNVFCVCVQSYCPSRCPLRFFYWKDVTLHGCVCVFVCELFFFYLALKDFFFFLSITTRLHILLCIYCLSCRWVCLYNKNISNVNCFFFPFFSQ